SIGAYAGDSESYDIFSPLLNPIIEEYHNFSQKKKHKSNLNPDDFNAVNPDKENSYILSTRIRVARNITDTPLGSAISDEQRNKIEKDISQILTQFKGNLAGNYYALNSLTDQEKKSLIKEHFLFKAGDRFLESAGLNRDWPNGRGIFHNNEKTFLVWINEEDQLRIISMQKGGDIKEVFTRLVDAISQIEEKISFSYSERLGYITSCPTNLGTAMRASVHIKLPNLAQNMDEFQSIVDKYNVQIRGIDGEHSQSKEGIYDISNKRRLGVTEVECIQDMYDGVVALIKREKELS
ncbi:MAG: phosphagen kinase, partial [Campylobacterota bacterium]|nr:phosphagen kinase [Campylobacterota bacterium]